MLQPNLFTDELIEKQKYHIAHNQKTQKFIFKTKTPEEEISEYIQNLKSPFLITKEKADKLKEEGHKLYWGIDAGAQSFGIACSFIKKENNKIVSCAPAYIQSFIVENLMPNKSGKSLTKENGEYRRVATSKRNKKARLKKLKNILANCKYFNLNQEEKRLFLKNPILYYEYLANQKNIILENAYKLRVKALKSKISPQELLFILLAIANHRGPNYNTAGSLGDKSNSDTAKKARALRDSDKDALVIRALYFQGKSKGTWRHKENIILREDIQAELETIFSKQKEIASSNYEDFMPQETLDEIISTIVDQNSLQVKNGGKCPIFNSLYKANFSSFEAFDFRLQKTLENFQLHKNSKKDEVVLLKDAMKATNTIDILNMWCNLAQTKLTVKFTIPFMLKYFLKDKYKDYVLVGNYAKSNQAKDEFALFNPAETVLIWKALKHSNANDHEAKRLTTLITQFFGRNKNLSERQNHIKKYLPKHIDSDKLFNDILNLSCSKYMEYSHKGLKYIINKSKLENQPISKVEQKMFRQIVSQASEIMEEIFPPIDDVLGEYINKQVLKNLSVFRKEILEIYNYFGHPNYIHIENAREIGEGEVSYPSIKGMKLDAVKEDIRKIFRTETPSDKQIKKYALWKEQNEKCAYSFRKISKLQLAEPSLVEIDHWFPKSKGYINGHKNLVLCFRGENQNKDNSSGYFWHKQKNTWDKFVKDMLPLYLTDDGKSTQKYEWLSNEEIENFKTSESTVYLKTNDSFSKNLAKYLNLVLFQGKGRGEENGTKVNIQTYSGSLTGKVRQACFSDENIWEKDRNTHYHHGFDALVLTMLSPSLAKFAALNKAKSKAAYLTEDTVLKSITKREMTAFLEQHYDGDTMKQLKKLLGSLSKEHDENNRYVKHFSKKRIGSIHNDGLISGFFAKINSSTGEVFDKLCFNKENYQKLKQMNNNQCPLNSKTIHKNTMYKIFEKNIITSETEFLKFFDKKYKGDNKILFPGDTIMLDDIQRKIASNPEYRAEDQVSFWLVKFYEIQKLKPKASSADEKAAEETQSFREFLLQKGIKIAKTPCYYRLVAGDSLSCDVIIKKHNFELKKFKSPAFKLLLFKENGKYRKREIPRRSSIIPLKKDELIIQKNDLLLIKALNEKFEIIKVVGKGTTSPNFEYKPLNFQSQKRLFFPLSQIDFLKILKSS